MVEGRSNFYLFLSPHGSFVSLSFFLIILLFSVPHIISSAIFNFPSVLINTNQRPAASGAVALTGARVRKEITPTAFMCSVDTQTQSEADLSRRACLLWTGPVSSDLWRWQDRLRSRSCSCCCCCWLQDAPTATNLLSSFMGFWTDRSSFKICLHSLQR